MAAGLRSFLSPLTLATALLVFAGCGGSAIDERGSGGAGGAVAAGGMGGAGGSGPLAGGGTSATSGDVVTDESASAELDE